VKRKDMYTDMLKPPLKTSTAKSKKVNTSSQTAKCSFERKLKAVQVKSAL
jgi:hypothetical protein